MKWLSCKIVFFAIISALLFVGGPLLINKAYRVGGYMTFWDANGLLSYYGAVLGGVATLIAVVITIKNESRNRMIEERKRKDSDKLQYVRSLLNNAVSILDPTHVPTIHITDSNMESALNHLHHLSLEVRRYTMLEALFDTEQKNILKDTTTKIRLYAEEYSSLINELVDTYYKKNTNKLYKTYVELLTSLRREPEANKIEIGEREEEFSKLSYVSMEDFEKLSLEVRSKIVSLSDSQYNDICDSVMVGINMLERHYEKQLDAF